MTERTARDSRFRHCVGAYFEMSTTDALRILPSHLQPVEIQHTRSILAVTAFEYAQSVVGPYSQVLLAVVVPPLVVPGRPLPKAAFYPFAVATDTEASRRHNVEHWHLPHCLGGLEIALVEDDGRMELSLRDDGRPVLDLSVTEYRYEPARNLFSSFMVCGTDCYEASISVEGLHSEHEEERGKLTLYEHPMTMGLTIDEVNTLPFREQRYKAGLQTFDLSEPL